MSKQTVTTNFDQEIKEFAQFLDEHTACKVIDLSNVNYRNEVSYFAILWQFLEGIFIIAQIFIGSVFMQSLLVLGMRMPAHQTYLYAG